MRIIGALTIALMLSGCVTLVGGSTTPEDLMAKKVYAEYTTKHEMIETFDCLARWTGTKVSIALRREISADGLQGHLFFKDLAGWANWTFFFQKSQSGKENSIAIYRSANVAGLVRYLNIATEACISDISSWPDSSF